MPGPDDTQPTFEVVANCDQAAGAASVRVPHPFGFKRVRFLRESLPLRAAQMLTAAEKAEALAKCDQLKGGASPRRLRIPPAFPTSHQSPFTNHWSPKIVPDILILCGRLAQTESGCLPAAGRPHPFLFQRVRYFSKTLKSL